MVFVSTIVKQKILSMFYLDRFRKPVCGYKIGFNETYQTPPKTNQTVLFYYFYFIQPKKGRRQTHCRWVCRCDKSKSSRKL